MKFLAWKEAQGEDVVFTPWSIVHVASGAAAKDLGIPFWWFEGLHALYEIKDQTSNDDIKNSLANSVGDQISGTVGHLIGKNTKSNTFVWLFVVVWCGAIFIGDDYG
jgi:hypothetical protein